ncbi:putative ribonuclease H-like domain-containing protein [Tanacetum coccineum]
MKIAYQDYLRDKLRIEQYFQVQDYAQWDVIENGNSFKPAAQITTNVDGTSTTLIPGPITTEEKVQKKNNVKARTMLLMALPNEHLMTFNQYKDAKTLFAAIQTRFGGFRRLNKPNLDTMSFDDLYNNFKIIEQEVKQLTAKTQVSPASTQVSPASTQVSTTRTQVSTTSTQKLLPVAIDEAGFDWSYMADDGAVPTRHLALIAFSDSEGWRRRGGRKGYTNVENGGAKGMATLDESMLWHRRLGHVNFKTINKLVKENLVRGLPSKRFENDQTCVACLKGKQHKASYFSWVFFLATKDETSGILKSFITKVENLVDKKVKIIRCDNGTEFKNKVMSEFYEKKGIKKEFSVARTPQQNGVAERGNRTLIEAARTMLANSKLEAFRVYNIRTRKVEEKLHIRFLEDKPIIAGDGPKWLFDINVLTKSMNYVPVVVGTNSNDLVGTEESIGAGHSSKETGSSQDYILMPLWKDGSLFDSSSKNASNDEPQPSSNAVKKDDEVTIAPLEATHDDFFGDETKVDMSNITTTYPVPSTLNIRIHKDHSLNHVIGDVQSGEEPKKVIQALKDPSWIEAMEEELLQFKLQQVWTLVDLPYCKRAIGYTQEEGIDYDEVFAPVARIESIRLFLAYASFKDFVVYQMDVKSAFLYGKIEEEVYVYQPPGFEDPEFPDRVYKVEKALYGLHQAPRGASDYAAKISNLVLLNSIRHYDNRKRLK